MNFDIVEITIVDKNFVLFHRRRIPHNTRQIFGIFRSKSTILFDDFRRSIRDSSWRRKASTVVHKFSKIGLSRDQSKLLRSAQEAMIAQLCPAVRLTDSCQSGNRPRFVKPKRKHAFRWYLCVLLTILFLCSVMYINPRVHAYSKVRAKYASRFSLSGGFFATDVC